MPGDHHQAAKAGQVGDDVLGDARADMVVARISRKIGKRKHGNRWSANGREFHKRRRARLGGRRRRRRIRPLDR